MTHNIYYCCHNPKYLYTCKSNNITLLAPLNTTLKLGYKIAKYVG